jgi:hypothetical protein
MTNGYRGRDFFVAGFRDRDSTAPFPRAVATVFLAVAFVPPARTCLVAALVLPRGDLVAGVFVFAGVTADSDMSNSDSRRVASSSCRCSAPIIRPSDSAERSSSDSLLRGFCAESAFLRVVIASPHGQ